MWQKIVEHLKDFVKKIKDAIERYAVEDKTVRAALKADAETIEELARQFDLCLKEAAGNKKASVENGGEKQSRRLKDSDLSDYLQAGDRLNKKKAEAITKDFEDP